MIYELRVYEAMPGKMDALNDRFATYSCAFLEKHGMQIVGFWTDMIGISNRLTYILAFEDLAQREHHWTAFGRDPEWRSILAQTEKDGPLVQKIESSILVSTSYSPLK